MMPSLKLLSPFFLLLLFVNKLSCAVATSTIGYEKREETAVGYYHAVSKETPSGKEGLSLRRTKEQRIDELEKAGGKDDHKDGKGKKDKLEDSKKSKGDRKGKKKEDVREDKGKKSKLPKESKKGKKGKKATETPSEVPSSVPSENPSSLPSEEPTEQPTMTPSSMPSSKPSLFPSPEPTYAPSLAPSLFPTQSPSNVPSPPPSPFPTERPTDFPSTMPSLAVCELGLNVTCDGCGPVPLSEECKGRPFSAFFRYNGGDCGQSSNQQIGPRFRCEDFFGGPPTVREGTVKVLVQDPRGRGITYFDGLAAPGDILEFEDGGNRFGAEMNMTVFAADNTTLLQTTVFSSSCAENFLLNDRFGSIELVQFINEEQGVVSVFANTTLSYLITSLSPDRSTVLEGFSLRQLSPFRLELNRTDEISGLILEPLESIMINMTIATDNSIGGPEYQVLTNVSGNFIDSGGVASCSAASSFNFTPGPPAAPTAVNIEECFNALQLADDDGDSTVMDFEYSGVVATLAPANAADIPRPLDPFSDLPPLLQAGFTNAACLCESVLDERRGCCLGFNARIEYFSELGGELSDLTRSELDYIRLACTAIKESLDDFF